MTVVKDLVDRIKGAIVLTSWVCVTLIVELILWMTQTQLELGSLIFVFSLYNALCSYCSIQVVWPPRRIIQARQVWMEKQMDKKKSQERLFEKESRVDAIEANTREGENTSKKTLCNRANALNKNC